MAASKRLIVEQRALFTFFRYKISLCFEGFALLSEHSLKAYKILMYLNNTYQWDCWETVGDSTLAQHICHKHVYWHTRLGWKETILGNSFFSGAKLRLELKYFLGFSCYGIRDKTLCFLGYKPSSTLGTTLGTNNVTKSLIIFFITRCFHNYW